MPDADVFFNEMEDWSQRKIDLIAAYIHGAAHILGTKTSMVYVDGFAGPGRYEDGNKGSPLRMAELAQECITNDWSYSFRCINVERVAGRFADLTSATAPYANLVTNFYGEFSDHANTILERIGMSPTVFFLDPFGVKGIPWSVICKIVGRHAPTDIWIRLDEKVVRRIEGFYASTTPEAVGKYEGTLSDLYGIPDRDDLHNQLNASTPERGGYSGPGNSIRSVCGLRLGKPDGSLAMQRPTTSGP